MALELAVKFQCDDFQQSNGWMGRFLQRYGLSRRRITTSGRDLPTDMLSVVNTYLDSTRNYIYSDSVSRESIINMDETAIYLDMLRKNIL